MPGLFAGTPLERPVTCEVCDQPLDACACPRDAAGRVVLPSSQVAVIRCEKRRHGRVVTTVTGLDPVASDPASLLRALRKACGAGGTVSADGAIEVQGDHRDAIAESLRAAGYRTRSA